MAAQKPATAQATSPTGAKKFELTIDNIMRGPGLVGYEPRAVRWSQDGQRIYFQWKQASEPREKDFDTYVVNRDGSGLKMLTEDEARNSPPVLGELSKDKKLTVLPTVPMCSSTTTRRANVARSPPPQTLKPIRDSLVTSGACTSLERTTCLLCRSTPAH
jgi:hypothetical protein